MSEQSSDGIIGNGEYEAYEAAERDEHGNLVASPGTPKTKEASPAPVTRQLTTIRTDAGAKIASLLPITDPDTAPPSNGELDSYESAARDGDGNLLPRLPGSPKS